MMREPVASHRLDDSGACIYSSDSVVLEIGKVKIAIRIRCDGRGLIAAEALGRPSHRLYDLCFRVDASHSIVPTVDQAKVSPLIEQQMR
jgi:hypothetical protein